MIALLIFVLMVTLPGRVLRDRRLAPPRASSGGRTRLRCSLFLPLIPHTKHLHLVLSPVTVFLSRGGFSKIPPLAGDEDFGLVAGKDLTQLVSLQAYSCVECGRCTEHCPANNTGKILNPKEIILGVRAYLNEFGPQSEEPLLGKYNSQEAVFQCTTCGACEFQCPVGIEHLPIIIGLRRGAVNTGTWEDDYGAKLFLASSSAAANALGHQRRGARQIHPEEALPIFDGTQEYCLWLGCMGGYDPKGREIVAGVRARDEASRHQLRRAAQGEMHRRSGAPPGQRSGLPAARRSEPRTLAQTKVKKIVSICPHCVRTIQEDWKEYGTPPPIEHHSEFLARYADQLAASPRPETRKKSSFTIPATWAAIATSTTSRAPLPRPPAR